MIAVAVLISLVLVSMSVATIGVIGHSIITQQNQPLQSRLNTERETA